MRHAELNCSSSSSSSLEFFCVYAQSSVFTWQRYKCLIVIIALHVIVPPADFSTLRLSLLELSWNWNTVVEEDGSGLFWYKFSLHPMPVRIFWYFLKFLNVFFDFNVFVFSILLQYSSLFQYQYLWLMVGKNYTYELEVHTFGLCGTVYNKLRSVCHTAVW